MVPESGSVVAEVQPMTQNSHSEVQFVGYVIVVDVDALLLKLLDFVRAVSGGTLGRFDLLAALATQNAHEAVHRVLLPAGGLDYFGEG